MANAVEDVQETLVFRQCEVFRQDIVYPNGRVLITTNDAHRHGQLLQPLPQPEAGHGAAAAQHPLDRVTGNVNLERLAEVLRDMWSMHGHILRPSPAGELL